MNSEKKIYRKNNKNERGAALITVIMISLFLLTASVAMLSAVGANSRNNTDVLSETKAYYAAESGLQATVNFLRNDTTVTPNSTIYSYSNANPTLSAKLPYNWPIGSPTRVVVGDTAAAYTSNAGTAYSINVTDPDSSEIRTTFSTNGAFLSTSLGILSGDARTIYVPNSTATNRTEITLTNSSAATVTFAGNPANPPLSTFQITNIGSGAQLALGVKVEFQVDFNMTIPRSGTRSIRGWFEPAAANGPPVVLKFISQNYTLLGSTIELCTTTIRPGVSPGCATVQQTLISGAAATPVYLFLSPVPPYRLLVRSTGYGPNGALKNLEGIVQRNVFNGFASGAATSLIGAPCVSTGPQDHCFEPGSSAGITYSGGNAETGVPAFGFTNTAYLTTANTYIAANFNPGQVSPPPALLSSDIPDWQQTPQGLDALVDLLREKAGTAGRYFVSPSQTLRNPGDYTTGTGITFCEGSCTVGNQGNGAGAGGGGILVVTGKLTSLGGFNFKGLIIVTGEEGWERGGGGGGDIRGNVVIAPYNRKTYVPENLSSTFLPPRYWITGGGASDVIYTDVSAAFDNLSSISDFMLGVAEK